MGLLLDWTLGYIFHESLKLMEDAHQRQYYAPQLESLTDLVHDPELAERMRDLLDIQSQTVESMRREVVRLESLLLVWCALPREVGDGVWGDVSAHSRGPLMSNGPSLMWGEAGGGLVGSGEGVDEEARALVGGGLGDLGLLEPAGDGIQHLGEAADGERAFVVRAMRVHGGLLGGEEEDVVVVSGRGQLGSADGEGGLAHAARAINERAPASGVGVEVREELGEFGIATEEALDGGEVAPKG